MLKNPKYYGISPEEAEEDPELLKRRVNLVHTAATIL
jgi:pre-mRNA-splicing helicase BRR2